MLLTHGHSDHTADVLRLAAEKKPKAIIGMLEMMDYFETKGVENGVGMNKGGSTEAEGLRVTMTNAHHSSSIGEEDGTIVYIGEPAGLVVTLENGFKIYFAGDTCVFGDMALIGELYAPDVAMLPIGDFYTMGPLEAAKAVELLGVKQVVPMHYGTFPALHRHAATGCARSSPSEGSATSSSSTPSRAGAPSNDLLAGRMRPRGGRVGRLGRVEVPRGRGGRAMGARRRRRDRDPELRERDLRPGRAGAARRWGRRPDGARPPGRRRPRPGPAAGGDRRRGGWIRDVHRERLLRVGGRPHRPVLRGPGQHPRRAARWSTRWRTRSSARRARWSSACWRRSPPRTRPAATAAGGSRRA